MSLTDALGLVTDLPEPDYHAHPALSQSGAKLLLRSPALYRYRRDVPEFSAAFDFGHAAHAKVLGVGSEVVVIDADDWRGKAAREARDAARAEGKAPLLAKEARTADALAESVLAHPVARAIFEREGQSELSVFWEESATLGWDTTAVPCRGRIDRLTTTTEGVPALVDLKTSVDASPESWRQAAARYGYDIQSAAYERGFTQAAGEQPAPMTFVVVEKEPPYLVGVYALDADFRARGERLWLDAVDIYGRCVDRDEWPGYSSDIVQLAPPRWAS